MEDFVEPGMDVRQKLVIPETFRAIQNTHKANKGVNNQQKITKTGESYGVSLPKFDICTTWEFVDPLKVWLLWFELCNPNIQDIQDIQSVRIERTNIGAKKVDWWIEQWKVECWQAKKTLTKAGVPIDCWHLEKRRLDRLTLSTNLKPGKSQWLKLPLAYAWAISGE